MRDLGDRVVLCHNKLPPTKVPFLIYASTVLESFRARLLIANRMKSHAVGA